ncbi:MAG: transcription termination factor NusA [Candidatus Paceibacterota bacterium]
MLDLKALKSALLQLEEEKKIPKDKIIDAIEQSLAAAYKKDYGKKGQIVRVKLDLDSGATEFFQIKIVVDESTVRFLEEGEDMEDFLEESTETLEEDVKPVFNPEKHILLADAKMIKKDAKLDEEIIFPLEMKDDFGRVAAQTAKQVIVQRIREAERGAVMEEYGDQEGEIINGIVQKVERGIIFVDFNKATGIIPREEQIFGERFVTGQRIKAYLTKVEEGHRGVNLFLSRTHPKFIEKLFAVEAPEIANGVVEIRSIAREAGARSKIAVYSHDGNIDPIGACVGQRGVRVTTVMNELGGEKIDIIPWSEDPEEFISSAISPAKILSIKLVERDNEKGESEKVAVIEVASDQLSLAIGKGGQNVRLAAKLTGWKIDIKGADAPAPETKEEKEEVAPEIVEESESEEE